MKSAFGKRLGKNYLSSGMPWVINHSWKDQQDLWRFVARLVEFQQIILKFVFFPDLTRGLLFAWESHETHGPLL
jgi:hypothetical protein